MSADTITAFREAMLTAGLNPPEYIEPGKLHRFSSNGKASDDAAWCKLFPDMQGGVFGDWRASFKGEWRASRAKEFTPEERESFKKQCESEHRKREADQAKRHAKAAKAAQALWKAATEARADHPYLARKGVQPVDTLREIALDSAAKIIGYSPAAKGEALAGRLLVVPVKVAGKLSTVELIDESGRKHFLSGSAKKSGFWAAQTLPGGNGEDLTICIGEGVATVLSPREATGYAVLAALDCGNLEAVAKAMRKRYPKGDIVLLADLGNGQKEAETAAGAVRGVCAVPVFADGEAGSDFNDLARLRGLDCVAAIINEALARGPEKDKPNGGQGPESHQGETSARGPGEHIPTFRFVPLKELMAKVCGTQYLVKPFVERATLAMIYGESQAYKSFIAVDLGLSIAHGVSFHGYPTRKGAVFYVCGEGHQGLGRRVLAWRIAHGTDPDTDAPFFVSEVPAELMDPDNAALVRAAVTALANEHGQPALIIVDTTSANMGDGDESSNSDVSRLLANISRELRAPFGAAVLLVHHCGWSAKDRTRGAYAFLGNTDSHIQAERCPDPDKRIVTLTCKKSKDAPMWDPVSFEARAVELGIKDSEGADESSLVMDKVDYVPSAAGGDLGKHDAVALAAFESLYAEQIRNIRALGRASEPLVLVKDWRKRFYDLSVTVSRDTKRQAWGRVVKSQCNGRVRIDGIHAYPATGGEGG